MKKGHGSKFGRKKEAAIAALLTAKNHEDAARATGIDLKTFKRRLREPEFIAEYRRARWEVVEQAYARAQQSTGAAFRGLAELLEAEARAASLREGAAYQWGPSTRSRGRVALSGWKGGLSAVPNTPPEETGLGGRDAESAEAR
jgi:hypothetical protein